MGERDLSAEPLRVNLSAQAWDAEVQSESVHPSLRVESVGHAAKKDAAGSRTIALPVNHELSEVGIVQLIERNLQFDNRGMWIDVTYALAQARNLRSTDVTTVNLLSPDVACRRHVRVAQDELTDPSSRQTLDELRCSAAPDGDHLTTLQVLDVVGRTNTLEHRQVVERGSAVFANDLKRNAVTLHSLGTASDGKRQKLERGVVNRGHHDGQQESVEFRYCLKDDLRVGLIARGRASHVAGVRVDESHELDFSRVPLLSKNPV